MRSKALGMVSERCILAVFALCFFFQVQGAFLPSQSVHKLKSQAIADSVRSLGEPEPAPDHDELVRADSCFEELMSPDRSDCLTSKLQAFYGREFLSVCQGAGDFLAVKERVCQNCPWSQYTEEDVIERLESGEPAFFNDFAVHPDCSIATALGGYRSRERASLHTFNPMLASAFVLAIVTGVISIEHPRKWKSVCVPRNGNNVDKEWVFLLGLWSLYRVAALLLLLPQTFLLVCDGRAAHWIHETFSLSAYYLMVFFTLNRVLRMRLYDMGDVQSSASAQPSRDDLTVENGCWSVVFIHATKNMFSRRQHPSPSPPPPEVRKAYRILWCLMLALFAFLVELVLTGASLVDAPKLFSLYDICKMAESDTPFGILQYSKVVFEIVAVVVYALRYTLPGYKRENNAVVPNHGWQFRVRQVTFVLLIMLSFVLLIAQSRASKLYRRTTGALIPKIVDHKVAPPYHEIFRTYRRLDSAFALLWRFASWPNVLFVSPDLVVFGRHRENALDILLLSFLGLMDEVLRKAIDAS